jgi:hypothetical protein
MTQPNEQKCDNEKLPVGIAGIQPAASRHQFVSLLVVLYFCTGIAVATFSWLFSAGGVSPGLLLKAVSINYFISVGLLVFRTRLRGFGGALMCVLTLLVAISLVARFWFFLVCAGAFSYRLYLDRRSVFTEPLRWGTIGGLSSAAVLLGLVSLAGRAWGYYIGPDIERNLMMGNVHMDSLFHASLAAMLREYGVLSTGLHGTPGVVYHALSHFLFSRISALTGLSVLEVYGAVQCIAIAPLLFIAVLLCAEELVPSSGRREFLVRIACNVVVFMAPLGYGIGDFGSRFALKDTHLSSESYCLSLILLLALIGSLSIRSSRERWVTVIVLLGATAAAKVSVGAIAILLLVLHVLLFERNKRLLAGIAITSILVAAAFVVPWIYLYRQNYGLTIPFRDPFQFAKYFGEVPISSSPRNIVFWVAMARFVAVHFAYTVLFFAVAGVSGWWRSSEWIDHKEALVLNLGALGAGLAAIALLPVRTQGGVGGNVYFFSNVAMFVALPYLLVVLSRQLSTPVWKFGGGGWWCSAAVAAAGVGGILIHGGSCLTSWSERLSISGVPAKSEFAAYVRHLLEVRDDPSTRDFLVYIAKEEHGFWDGAPPSYFGCTSFFIPAVSERAALFGLPIPNLEEERKRQGRRRNLSRSQSGFCPGGYCYESYSRESYELGSSPRVSEALLEEETRRLGFKGYIDLTLKGWVKRPLAQH